MLDDLLRVGLEVVAGRAIAVGAAAQCPGACERLGHHRAVLVYRGDEFGAVPKGANLARPQQERPGRRVVPATDSIGGGKVEREGHVEAARQDHLLVAPLDDLGDRGADPAAVVGAVGPHVDRRGGRRGGHTLGEQALQHPRVPGVGVAETHLGLADDDLRMRLEDTRQRRSRRQLPFQPEPVRAELERHPSVQAIGRQQQAVHRLTEDRAWIPRPSVVLDDVTRDEP